MRHWDCQWPTHRIHVTSASQLVSRKALWGVLCALEDSRIKVRPQRKFLALYAGTNFGYYLLADGTMMVVNITGGVTQGCNFGTLRVRLLLFNLDTRCWS